MSHGFDSLLPDRILKMVDPRDRHLLKDQETFDEVMKKAKVKVERDLHDMIEALFRRNGITYVHSRMDRKTTIRPGLPDFMFVVGVEISHPPGTMVAMAVALEVKLPGEDLDEDQKEVMAEMTQAPNIWQWFTVRSYAEVLEILRRIGFMFT